MWQLEAYKSRGLSAVTMSIEVVTVLILLCLHGANFQEEGMCSSSLEMRRAAVDKQLAAMGCETHHCGNLMNNHNFRSSVAGIGGIN